MRIRAAGLIVLVSFLSGAKAVHAVLPGIVIKDGIVYDSANDRSVVRPLVRGPDGRLHTVYTRSGSNTDIYYAVSTDNGQTWMEESVTAAAQGQSMPTLAVDSANTVHVVWFGRGWGVNSGNDNIQYRRRTSGGWQAQESVSDVATDQRYPAIAVDSANNVHVTWVTFLSDLHYRKRVGGAWQASETVATNGSDQWRPSIALDAGDNVHVAWFGKGWGTNSTNDNIQYRRRTSGGWQAQESVTDINRDQGPAQIAIDSGGNVHLVWLGQGWGANSANLNVQYEKRTSGGWQPREGVTDKPVHQYSPTLSLDSADNITVVWTGLGWGANTAVTNIQVRERLPAGGWQAQVGLTDDAIGQVDPTQVWGMDPTLAGAHPARPVTGYGFSWTANTGATYQTRYLGSPDLTWEASILTSVFENAVSSNSVTLSYAAAAGAGGYTVEASTSVADFTPLKASSITYDVSLTTLTVAGLDADTTYYLRVGALYSGTTAYSASLTTVTLTDAVQNVQIAQIYTTSITVHWTPLGIGQGYRLEASTCSDFSMIAGSSETTQMSVSTLAVQGLAQGVMYYLRVGAKNWIGLPNYVPALSPGGDTAWVSDYWSSGAWPIYNLSASPTQGAGFSDLGAVTGIAFTLDGNTALVSDNGGGRVWPIHNLKTSPVKGDPITGLTAGGPEKIAMTPDGDTAWVADLTGGKVWPVYHLTTTPSLGAPVSGGGLAGPVDLAITPDGDTAWVADYNGNAVRPISSLKSVPSVGAAVSTIDAPVRIVITPDGNKAWVIGSANPCKMWSIINLKTSPVQGVVFPLPGGASDIALSPDGDTAWVADGGQFIWPIRHLKTTPAAGAPVTAAGMININSVAITPDGNTAWVTDYSTGKVWPINNLIWNPTAGSAVPGTTFSGPWAIAIMPKPTSTLTDAIQNGQIYRVYPSSLTVNWTSVSNGVGYRLEASTDAAFPSAAAFAVTEVLSVSTLTLQGLMSNTTYYLRVSGRNVAGTYHWADLGSTTTPLGLPPVPFIRAASSFTLTAVWETVGGAAGYRLEASTSTGDFNSLKASSATFDASMSTLTVSGLDPDTTYYLRAGALCAGATIYSTYFSTAVTLTGLLQNVQVSQTYSSSITVTWMALGIGEGYRLEASSFSDFSTIAASSQTASLALNTLAVQGLTQGVVYYLRVGGINGNNAANYVPVGNAGAGDTAWVSIENGNGVRPIQHLQSNPTVGTGIFPPGSSLEGIAITPDGNTAWVTDYNNTVWPINNLKTNPAQGTPVGGMINPFGIAITPDGNTAWVADGAGPLWPINNLATSPTRGTAIPGMTGTSIRYIAITPDGNTALVSDYNAGKIYPVNHLKSTPAFGTPISAPGGLPAVVAISPDGNTGWVADEGGYVFSVDNLRTSPTLGTAVPIPGGSPWGIAIAPDGNTAWEADEDGSVRPIRNLQTSPALGSAIPINGNSQFSSIAITPDGNSALVTDYAAGNVWPIHNLKTTPTRGTGISGLGGNVYVSIAIPPASAFATLTDAVQGGQIFKVYSTSITANWAALSAGLGYRLEASTSAGFFPVAAYAMADSLSVSTLTVQGLLSDTTYYLRVSGLDSVGIYNWTVLGSSKTQGASVPTGLAGTAASVSSINWSWNPVGGASSYLIYQGTSPATLIGTSSGASWVENFLSANMPYGRVVAAVVSGSTTSLSASATAYTLSNMPAVPAISNIMSSSFTVAWGTAGNPSDTPYQIELAPDSSFMVGVTTPVPFSSNLTANTTNVVGLSPNTHYWVRVTAQNHDGIPTNPGPSASATTQLNGTMTGSGSGLGTVLRSPAGVPEGGVVTTTMTFTVPAGGMSAGGRLEFDLPSGWWPGMLQNYSVIQDGYVTAVTTAPVTLNLLFGNTVPAVTVSFVSGFLSAGTTVQVTFNNIHPNCPLPGQTQAVWEVKSAMTPGDPLGDIAIQPAQTLSAGQAQWLGYTNWNPLTVVAGQPSGALQIQADDNCGQPVNLASPLTVTLTPLFSDGFTFDPQAKFAASLSMSPSTTSVVIPAASSTTVFYYQRSTGGGSFQIRGDYLSPAGSFSQQIWRQVNVLSMGLSFANVSVDNGAPVPGQKTAGLSPDGSGINNFVYVRFTPSDNASQWHVTISSDGFQSFVYERWGNGDPQGAISWDGRSYNAGSAGTTASMPQTVPNGTYEVKIEVLGLVTDTTLSITVNSAQISGRVTYGGVGVQGAQVNAQGSNTPGYSFTTTDPAGYYTLNGLRAGYQYNLYANYMNPSNQSIASGQLSNIPANTGNQDFALSAPSVIRIAAVTSAAAPVPVFGSINAHSADWSKNYNGNLRLLTGTTTSDNGDPFSPSSWTLLYVDPAPGAYVLHFFLPGFGINDMTVPASTDVVVNLIQKANIYGLITLPAAVANPTWISVQGVPQGTSSLTVWGGVFFDVGQSSGVYSIYSVDPGIYSFVAQPPGYVPASVTRTVTGVDIGNPITGAGVDFSSSDFSIGGQISGQLTVNGNTTDQANPFTLWISAYSPSLGLNVSTQVSLPTDLQTTTASYQLPGVADGTYQVFPPYLQGFEASPPGPQNVTVVNHSGQLNITLNQVTGRISGNVSLGGAGDYASVHLSLQGPYQKEVNLSGPVYSLTNLGTGNYTLMATYQTTGAQVQKSFLLSNGQALAMDLNLGAQTYAVSGTVSVQNAFPIRNSSGSLVAINTLGDLLANATSQVVTLGATVLPGNAAGAAGCTGGTPTVLSTVRVEAFPKDFNSYGSASRSGFTNCFGVGQYKYALIDSSGNYTVSGLMPGVWEISVYPYFDGGQAPNAAATMQVVTVVNGNIPNVNFPLSYGYAVSGTVSLPAGVTDSRSFNAQVVNPRGDLIQSAVITIPGAGSVTYKFTGLPSGQYSLLIQDQGSYDPTLKRNVTKYVAKPAPFTIAGADAPSINVSLTRSSSIVGKLLIQSANPGGKLTLTLITPNNQNLLPGNFSINANADPWVPGGNAQAEWNTSGAGGLYIDSNNQFHIDGLVAGTYDVNFQQFSYGLSAQSAGSINLASLTQGSVQVGEAQTIDLGTISLVPGISLSGTVTDLSGNGLANIPVQARPANSKNGNDTIQVFTDAQGNFTLTGLNPGIRIYDIVAARRPSPGDTSTQPVPHGEASKLAVDVTQDPPPVLSFILPDANGQLTGRVATIDGGSLGYPENDNAGFPVAAVYFRAQGTVNEDNPLGDVAATALDGTFSIPYIPAGIYDLTVESLGYRPLMLTGISITNASKDLGTLTLQKGPSLKAMLVKPDGSSVNTSDVQMAVAATADLGSIIFGQITSDSKTNNIASIQFSGFELTPKVYSVMLFDNQGNIVVPPEGKSLVFANNTDSVVKTLTYQPSAPFAFIHIRKSGNTVLLTYYFSRPLRNRGDDQDPTQWVSITKGKGTLSGLTLSSDRRQFTVSYTPGSGEQNATILFSAHTVDVDPSTSVEFVLSKTVTLLLGQKATAENNINPVLGGKVTLADDNDPSSVVVPSNALLAANGVQADASTSYSVTFTATDDVASVSAGVVQGSAAPGVEALMERGAAAYVSEAWQAMQTIAQSRSLKPQDSSVSPFSSFYSVLLPEGISHSLNQNATLMLHYNTDADPAKINVYFFNGTEYLIENNSRLIDPVNHTISVGVSHFSTFVALQNNAPVIFVNGDNASGGDIDVFNFPNPFDLQPKTKTLNHDNAGSGVMTTDGTIIRYVVPAVMVGLAHVDIYDVVGEKVRSIDLGTPSGGVYNYVDWDGRNSSGNKVASGVYIGVLKVGGAKKFWKMAVIK